MVQLLERLTTEFIMAEDRIRLSGQLGADKTIAIWLTRRMLQRMIPSLLGWLERQNAAINRPEIVLGFAQQAARATLEPQAPVRPLENGPSWVATSVDVISMQHALKLTFRGVETNSASLMLEARPLRQWINMLYDIDRKAEWHVEQWPAWLLESSSAAPAESTILH